MAGLVPAIHALADNQGQDVDGRDKRGHDELERPTPTNKGGPDMFRSTQTLTRSAVALIGLAALAGAFGLGTVAQQTPATKVSQLMTKTLADVPGREVMMITLDI